ncbi:MAG: hypothetical protein CMJ81_08755 [Planctomycetaceae bacterium]|nr:hypothetical protein [Planctomycetaceae bacterium]MBP61726.1 hypothetical protein [Planctomycetaceae bacterium]
MRTVWITFLVFTVTASGATSFGAPWQAGVASVNITPLEPMWLSGYGGRDKPATGKRTDLWAKALSLTAADGQPAVLVTMDLLGIDRTLSLEICHRLEQRYNLRRADIVLSVSHTHTGPVVGRNLACAYDLDARQQSLIDQYAADLVTKIVQVVGTAITNAETATLSTGTGTATFAVNRRNNPESEVSELRAANKLAGPVDHDVPVLVVRATDGALLAVVCGYACHATVLNDYSWSGDWPGFTQLELERRHPGSTALFWAGCGADQNPLPRRQVELAQSYGRQLADAVDTVLESDMTAIPSRWRRTYEEIDLQFASLPSREQLAIEASGNNAAARRARLLLQQWDRDGQLAPNYPYPVQTWQLGDHLTWVFLGGEVVVDYALRLKRELSPHRTWVAGYANDVMAYIPSRRVLLEGGYEGGGAMVYYGLPSAWTVEVEKQIVAHVRSQVGAHDIDRSSQPP